MAIKLKVQETTPVKLKVNGADEVRLKVSDGVPIYPNPYEGAYEVTPTESEQTLSTNGLMMTDDVTVHAIDSEYVGSEVPRRSSSDLTSSGATVSVPSGFYEEDASKSIPTGTVVPASGIVAIDATLTASDNKLSLYKESRNAPYVSTPGYVESGTMGVTKITLTADVPTNSSSDLTVSGDTVTAPSGYYGSNASASVQSGTEGTPTATKSAVSNHSISVTPSVTNAEGYISGGTHNGTAVSVSASELVSGTLTVDSSGTKNVTNYASVSVPSGSATTPTGGITANPTISVDANGLITASVSKSESITPIVNEGYVSEGTAGTITFSGSNTSQLSTQAGSTITPTTSEQTAVPANTYTTGAVKVSAMPNGTKGNQVNTWSSTSTKKKLTVSFPDATSGYYNANTVKTVDPIELTRQTETVTPTESSQEVTPTNSTYYLEKVTVNAIPSDYVGSGITQRASADLTANGATVTAPAGYYENDATKTISSGSATPAASISGSSASKVVGNGTITLSKTIANTPQVSAGYVASGTQGNTSVELSASITTKGATTYHPSTTNQTIASMTYLTGTQTINAVTHNLLAENIKDGVTLKIGDSSDDDCVASVTGSYIGGGGTPNLQAKTNIDPTTSSQTITADTGYDGLSSVQINAMPSGTEGTPTATKGTVTNHSVTVTPNVTNTAGYISGGSHSGTAVSVTASELVSGTVSITSSGNTDVTNYATATVASGSATASATKGTVSNHSITVTPSVTRTAGYITAGSANGTAVTVSASELVSGSETKTANGTYDVTNLAELVVNVSGGTSKNTQVVQGTTRTTSSSMTAIGAELTVSKTGTYDVYWSAFRSSTSSSYTYATQLYIDNTAHGSENSTWTNHVQNNHLTSVSLTVNQKIRVRGRNSRGSSYYIYAPTLVIVEN